MKEEKINRGWRYYTTLFISTLVVISLGYMVIDESIKDVFKKRRRNQINKNPSNLLLRNIERSKLLENERTLAQESNQIRLDDHDDKKEHDDDKDEKEEYDHDDDEDHAKKGAAVNTADGHATENGTLY